MNITLKVVWEGLNYPNGLAITRDRRHLYVAEFVGKDIQVFEVNQRDKSLTHIRSINTHSHPDNIEIDHDSGDLWIGTIILFKPIKILVKRFSAKKHKLWKSSNKASCSCA